MSVKTSNAIIHRADSIGSANHGWLIARHSFSFANYYNPDRINFGALRVLNDDIIKPGKGFGTHPHDNMEIVTIPLKGSLAHEDSTGHKQEIKAGEVQIMSAGSGINHSEYNYSETEEVNLLQIWVMPKEKNIPPRYDQRDFSEPLENNELVTLVSPSNEESLWINQDAEFSLGKLCKGTQLVHKLKFKGNGIYTFLIEGQATINDQKLNRRDAVGFFDENKISIDITADSTILLIEVPKIY